MGSTHGPISRTGIPPIKRATGGFSSGCARVCWGAFSRSSPRLSTTKAIWICRKPSSMGASHQRSREAPAWARRSAGRARRSWRSPIAADSRSRFTSRVPRLLARRGVELIAPHRRTRTSRTQDGRPLRRYRRRWKIERLFVWFQNFRRLVVRYERYAENFLRCYTRLLPHSLARLMRWLLVS
jgi:transposase